MKTRPTPAPKPFFQETAHNLLSDFYRGEYIDLVQRKIPLGPALVFYYAPWDSESIAARDVFLQVAQYFHKTLPGQIRFYAVNCWWPEGECRKNYKNLSHFPIFVGHVEKTTVSLVVLNDHEYFSNNINNKAEFSNGTYKN
jgi:hypothetical protein